MTTSDKILFDNFPFHGVHFHKIPVGGKGEAVGDCPFCGKSEHLFVQKATSQWKCHKCGKEGNAYSFLREHHAKALKQTKGTDYEALASARPGIHPAEAKLFKLAYDRPKHRWLFPVTNGQNALVNLRVWDGFAAKPAVISSPACKLHLFGTSDLKSVGPIWLCEGEWDALALAHLFSKVGVDLGTNSILAVPGASYNLDKDKEVFRGREVYLCYDNDPPGVDGQAKAKQTLEKVTKQIHAIRWPTDLPAGYDIRDYVAERSASRTSLKNAWKGLQDLFKLSEAPTKTTKLPNVTDFPSLVKEFHKVLHLKQNQIDALALSVAVCFSQKLHGDPLWLFLVGPAGSGKSEMLMAFSSLEEMVYFVSRLTSETLISGYSSGDEDPSLLSRLGNRCLVVKDFTTVKGMGIDRQEDLFSILRDAYDGKVDRPYGNNVERNYTDCQFPMLAGITHVVHGDNRASVGERFLKFEILAADHDVDKHIFSAMSHATVDVTKAARNDAQLRDAVFAFFLNRDLKDFKLAPIINTPWADKIIALSHVVAVARTKADHGTKPIPETPTRIASQLAKLSQCLAWVHGEPKITDDVFRVVKKTASDTAIGWTIETLSALASLPEKSPGLGEYELAEHIRTSVGTIRESLQTLYQISYPYAPNKHGPVITCDFAINPETERRYRAYKLDPRFLAYWRVAGLRADDVTHYVSHRGPKPKLKGPPLGKRKTPKRKPAKKGDQK